MKLLDYTLDELRRLFQEWGHEPYRAAQVMDWIYKRRVTGFDRMANVPRTLRSKLENEFVLYPLQLLKKFPSQRDPTTKYLFAEDSGHTIESVFLPSGERTTVCVSTQAGCPLQCAFCASGMAGWKKNLSSSEIVSQILLIMHEEKLSRVQNVVFMGMGEPLLNYGNVLRAVEICNAPWGLGIASRKITLSTAGIVPGIRKLAREPKQIRLSISLHAPQDDLRSRLMPINKKYPLKELLAAAKDYVEATGRKIGIEYVLIDGLNDKPEQAEKLARLVKGIAQGINLIPLNLVAEFHHRPPDLKRQHAFQKILLSRGIKATLRREKGEDVNAACGQLRLQPSSQGVNKGG